MDYGYHSYSLPFSLTHRANPIPLRQAPHQLPAQLLRTVGIAFHQGLLDVAQLGFHILLELLRLFRGYRVAVAELVGQLLQGGLQGCVGALAHQRGGEGFAMTVPSRMNAPYRD